MGSNTLAHPPMKFKFTPSKKAAIFLMIYSAGALGFNFKPEVALHLAATLGVGIALYYLYSFVFKKKKSLEDTIITSLIIFLVLHYGSMPMDHLMPALATFFAITAKFFFEIKGKPIFNPAVGGLLGLVALGYLIPNMELPFVSWWGVNYESYISLALIAVWILTELKIWRKYPIVITFLLTYGIILLIQDKTELLQFTFTDATIYFLVGIMLVEPKTSPIKRLDQMVYALIAVATYQLLFYYNLPYIGLLTIATANLFNTALRFRPQPKKTVIKV